ncbi:helix-turn-helix domain-containing protein, partial [Alphaproteobacteria bacterium]|nr:helix-turn-helix domain-containing protein [Alphaproteobacteria bacterium]
IEEFIKNIKGYNFLSNSFSNTMLDESNFLINLNNHKKIYLTDSEYKLLQCLFEHTTYKKEKLKVEILNFHNSLETKSLESHLSRIRRKLEKINSEISIISVDNQFVKII